MQGSKHEMAVHDQDYRDEIAAIVHRHHPQVEIVDPGIDPAAAFVAAYFEDSIVGFMQVNINGDTAVIRQILSLMKYSRKSMKKIRHPFEHPDFYLH